MRLAPALSALAISTIVVDAAAASSFDHPVHAELESDAGWTHSYTSDAVEVFKKPLKSVNLTAWMGKTTLPASVQADDLFSLLNDLESHKRYNRTLAESVVLERNGNITTFYQVVHTPSYVPISDRWWVAQTKNIRDVDGTPGHLRRIWVTVPSESVPAVGPKLMTNYPKAIEIPFSAGRWDLLPQPDGSVEVNYRIVTDVGGSIPTSLYARFAGRSIADNLRVMLNAAESR